MSLTICSDTKVVAQRLADLLAAGVRAKPDLVLGLATGFTLARAYRELVRRQQIELDLTFRLVTTFNTDEFAGVRPEDVRSSRYFMNRHLFVHLDIKRENTFVPFGISKDLDAECEAYEALLRSRGGIDLAVLGLGHNGHVGFNEPGSSAKSRTRLVEFTEDTLAALSDGNRFTDLDDTPRAAITMGLGTILEARRIIVVATGVSKAPVLARVFGKRPGPAVPASLLLDHPNVEFIVDREAASSLKDGEVEATHV